MDIMIILILIIFGISIILANSSLAPWVPTKKKDLKRILKLLSLNSTSVFYELGCGNGRVVCYVNKKSDAKSVGLELSLPLFLICKIRKILNFNRNINFLFKDLYKTNLKEATHVYIFGMRKKLIKLKNKFKKELNPGTIIMSYVFPIEGWEAIKIDKPTENDLPIYIYKI